MKDMFRSGLRVALSSYVTNGASAAVGLLIVSTLVHLWFGAAAGEAGRACITDWLGQIRR